MNDFGRQIRIATSRAAVSSVAHSSQREVVVGLQRLRDAAQLGEVDAVVVTVSLVDLAHPRVFERGEFGQHLVDPRVDRVSAISPLLWSESA